MHLLFCALSVLRVAGYDGLSYKQVVTSLVFSPTIPCHSKNFEESDLKTPGDSLPRVHIARLTIYRSFRGEVNVFAH